MSQPRLFLFGLLVLGLTACNLSPLFASLPLNQEEKTPTAAAMAEAQPESDDKAQTAQAQASLQTSPALSPEPTPLPPAAIAEADSEELLLINLYERVNPSVVNIVVTVDEAGNENSFDQELFPSQGQGSGFVYDREGHIITNFHVVAEATKVQVTFYDGTTIDAKIVGSDPDSDLAVVKVEASPDSLRPVTWGDSDKLHVGQRAVAIGNPFGLSGTLTTGIISALKRSLPTENSSFRIPEIVQTDAAINPGNSGGPLLNSHGEVIGVNAAIVPRFNSLGERSFLGVGFAIPSNLVRRVVAGLVEDGTYEHPWIGFSGSTVTPEIVKAMNLPKSFGALVSEVLSGSPADEAGLRSGTREFELSNGYVTRIGGDVIIAIENEEIHSFDDLISFLSRRGQVGQKVTLTIIRSGKELQIPVTLGPRPAADETE